MSIPERCVVLGAGKHGPSLEWYVEYVRSELSDKTGPRHHAFVTHKGKPRTIDAIRNLESQGIHMALSVNNISGHPLRHACATWRHHHGWDLQDIADLLDDDATSSKAATWTGVAQGGWTQVAGKGPVPAGHVEPCRREGDFVTTAHFGGSYRILAWGVKSPLEDGGRPNLRTPHSGRIPKLNVRNS